MRFWVSYNKDSETEPDIDPWEVLVMDGRGVPAALETSRSWTEADNWAKNPTSHMLRMASEYEALR